MVELRVSVRLQPIKNRDIKGENNPLRGSNKINEKQEQEKYSVSPQEQLFEVSFVTITRLENKYIKKTEWICQHRKQGLQEEKKVMRAHLKDRKTQDRKRESSTPFWVLPQPFMK